MLICGIDIGKNHHEASLIDETGRLITKSIRFPNSTSGANALIDYFTLNNPDSHIIVIGMEATGHYWLSLYCFLFDQGYQVNVINPIQSDAVRNLFLRKTKNDSKDSFLIAETIRIGRFSNTTLADESILAMRQLCRHRMDLVDYISDQKRKIIGVMDRVFPEYQHFFSDMFGKSSTELLSKAITPEEILAIPTEELCAILQKASRGKFGIDKVQQIRNAAQTSFGITIATSAFSMQLRQLLEMIELLERQLSDLDEEIAKLLHAMDTCITSCPGVGDVLGAVILGEIGDISRFPEPKKLVAFVGVDPSVKQSGEFTGTQNKISKRGSPHLRRAIWLAATVAAFHDPVLSAFYQKKRAEGKHHSTAIGAVARKLTLIIYAVLRDNEPYVPNC
ncbi:IS110 family transposase [Enterococcus faecalis]|uniref:IS110 family transposase n=1 Tax=Enterococcus faecalis TaxID=1351 RepID=A0AC59HKN4_ENTFL|nr:IS110 family transposase [Enterococcus faecalis]BDQ44893.1 IS110 family transposase [Enterococcus faecalis]BDQ48622.1 IS110 family transposase [Enterococcus faecalis]BDQ59276.1 IS110 family transposase [Enterococcus faecalis]BDQ60287.1 IS110 family transposase [Enterococcus faecalis]